jgi:4-oxalocrotonate tautomerase
MALIQVKLIEGVFTSPQKQEIVERLTDAMVEIEGENMRKATWCGIAKVDSEVGCAAHSWRARHHVGRLAVRALSAGRTCSIRIACALISASCAPPRAAQSLVSFSTMRRCLPTEQRR